MSTGTLSVLDNSGDSRHQWDTSNDDEVAAARAVFDDFTKTKKYLAYRVTDDGKGEQMREFDPSAGEVILAPQTVGG